MHSRNRFKLFSETEAKIGFIVGTGPSLTEIVLEQIKPYRKFGVNNAYQVCDLDVHLACNIEWWDTYHDDIASHRCDKWTWDHATAERYRINYIRGEWGDGLSTDPNVIHYHHGSGPQMVNLALHYGCEVMVLVGWDMRYPPGEKRHYFGEYPAHLQHWPRTGPNGEMEGLIKEMETIKPEDYGIQIINCTPDSALTCFPMMDLSRFISEYLSDSNASKA